MNNVPARALVILAIWVLCGVSSERSLRGGFAADEPSSITARAEMSPAETKRAVEEFEALYALPDGEVLKRIKPPFSPARLIYYRHTSSFQAEKIPSGPQLMYFRWKDNKLMNEGMTFSMTGGESIPQIMETLVGIYPQECDGDPKLLKRDFRGDFIVRVDAPIEQVVRRMQEILNEETPIEIELREVEREVFVARGRYEFHPVNEPNRADAKQIELYGTKLNEDPHAGGGGSGDLAKFLQWTGMWIRRGIVNEIESFPDEEVSWHMNGDPPEKGDQKAARSPELVLKNVTAQTGLTFTLETRKVRVLFVDRPQFMKN